MEQNMFCFQCEQTAGCTGCTGRAGVCGKSAATAGLQDELTGALIGLARVCAGQPRTEETDRLILEGLFTTVTNVSFHDGTLRALIDRVNAEKARLMPGCAGCAAPCGNTDNYDLGRLWNADEDVRSLKSLILFGIRGMAAYRALVSGTPIFLAVWLILLFLDVPLAGLLVVCAGYLLNFGVYAYHLVKLQKEM